MDSAIKIKTLPLVAIIGRMNVGKSTLFNRVIEKSKAITSPIPGTTRDVLYGAPVWRGKTFGIVDTAGLDIHGKGELERNVLKQIERAEKEADILLLILDLQVGVQTEDKNLIRKLLAQKKPFLVVANKADNARTRANLMNKEWHNLPVKKIIPVSAKNGAGAGDLLDEIYNLFREAEITLPAASAEERSIDVCILGKPNVGKSSLLNSLLKKEVAVVSAIPHTTREPQDITFDYNGRTITLIDTAGIRRRARVEQGFERTGVKKSIGTLKRSDIALLVLDISQDLGSQDKRLAELISESNKGLIIIANKVDLVKSEEWHRTFTQYLHRYLPFLDWAPIIFVSALTSEKVHKIYDKILEVDESRKKTIDPKELEDFIKETSRLHKPLKAKGVRHPYIFGIKQTRTAPPAFVIAIKEKTSVHESYLKFLSKKIRERFGFEGVPITVETKHISI